ncbi:MAG TPA: methylmalonyl-CoA mutase family protein [Candidatus Wallbacteria bacterium]|nr:MAG: Methylmalonyl-CoA mutase [bacterium ADurb.Bin243]HPG56621.1 methylmalonyl-CoA mutase family protein [Candidatus Wallbacteria bacterium]
MNLEKMKESFNKWKSDYNKKKDASKLRQKKFMSVSSYEPEPLYTPLDLEGFDYFEKLGIPGDYPFTRGVHNTLYREKLWTMRQFAGFGTAKQSNERYKYLLKNGQTGLSVAFHLPTLMGLDSDNPLSRGEIGKDGVAIDTLADMETLFDGIPLDRVSTSMTINAPAAILLAMYIAVAKKQGVAPEKLSGTIQNDILKEYIAQKTFIFPPEPSIKLIVDTIEYCSKHLPAWNTISISGYHIREAGATALQELAFTLIDGRTYVEAAIARGLDVNEFAPRLSFFFNSHNDFFEEVAKFRAARRIWAKLMKEKFGASSQRAQLMRFHTQTAGCSLTANQIENNIVRVTIQALAAVMGGTQSLHTNSMDEALALPTEKAVRIALRTQQIIANESGAANVIDPLGGSYYVEKLTDEMEKGVMDYFDRIDRMGGVLSAIDKGFFQSEISDAAFRYQREIEKNERIVVGVNSYCDGNNEKGGGEILKIDEKIEREQVASLTQLKKKRDNDKVKSSLERLKNDAKSGANVMYALIDCVEAYASLGEMCDVFREVYGVYEEPPMF